MTTNDKVKLFLIRLMRQQEYTDLEIAETLME